MTHRDRHTGCRALISHVLHTPPYGTIQAVLLESAVPKAKAHASAAYTKQYTGECRATKQLYPACSVSEAHLTEHIVLQVGFTNGAGYADFFDATCLIDNTCCAAVPLEELHESSVQDKLAWGLPCRRQICADWQSSVIRTCEPQKRSFSSSWPCCLLCRSVASMSALLAVQHCERSIRDGVEEDVHASQDGDALPGCQGELPEAQDLVSCGRRHAREAFRHGLLRKLGVAHCLRTSGML